MKKWICLMLAALILFCAAAFAEETSSPTAAAQTAKVVADDSQTDAGADAPDEIAEEPAEEETDDSSGFVFSLDKLFSMNWYTILIVIALFIAAILLFRNVQKTRWNSRVLASGAMCIAISFVLSYIPIYHMPQGGTVTPASMLPIILFALSFGPGYGLIAGAAFGLLNLIGEFYVIHPMQLLMDYPFAYAALALCCAASAVKDPRKRLVLAVVLGYFGRLVVSTLSGVWFFAEYAGDQNVWAYSVLYNLSYLGPEAVLAAVIVLIPGMNRVMDALKNGRAK